MHMYELKRLDPNPILRPDIQDLVEMLSNSGNYRSPGAILMKWVDKQPWRVLLAIWLHFPEQH